MCDARLGDARILPVAGALASHDPTNSKWAEIGDRIAGAMVRSPIDEWRGWRESLASVRDALVDPLARIHRDTGYPEVERTVASDILAHYAAARPSFSS